MNQVVINCKFNQQDTFQMGGAIEYNINDNSIFTYTFLNNNLKKLPKFPSNIGLDLLYVSLFIFGADRIISRELAKDNWTRNIRLNIPVLEKERWERNKRLVEEMLTFLSGDIWELEFRDREFTEGELKLKTKLEKKKSNIIDVETICMFSGGLDSFIGAIDILEGCSEPNVLFISHYGGGKGVKEYQDILRHKLVSKYSIAADNFMNFYASAKKGIEDTTRTRSFMFFSHAIAIATSMKESIKLIIPENGLIALNIPLTNSRLGSSSTRTTHPYYLRTFQELLNNLDINVEISNPYRFKTKGEMMNCAKNKVFLIENLFNTMSCSHPDQGRMLGESEPCHCGTCLPCVIRRAAIKKANISDNTNYRDLDFNSGETAKINFSSYLLGVRKFEEKFAFLSIQKSGPIVEDISEYAALYSRGMLEVLLMLEEYVN
ncbi:ATPase [Bacillus cereus]|uniref:Qat anti-phage system QueC-like protein QatC n=1 Tax=Bacillus cereus TaxID=1396 RepID=UPI000BED1972|nr:Qat anti-phage system QueC-like protein QatC [Bacillus cereus]PEC89406.1 ATPase [Bacillus cereus]PFO03469.1 ATPase [Bacillus cereus]PFO75288.1 ATPase [Bacillus cereus]PGN75023.1 ATPase [Bacillus cereus]